MGESEAEYVTLHPLVALVMRDGSMVSEQSQAQSWARDVMPKLFRYRIKSWPMNAFYWKKAWDGPRESLRWEFYNFLGAAYCAIYRAVDIKPSMLATLMLLGLAQATSKGLVWDRSRRPLMASFWRTAANGMRHERQRSREAARRVVPVNDWLLRLIGHMGGQRWRDQRPSRDRHDERDAAPPARPLRRFGRDGLLHVPDRLLHAP